MQGPLARSSSVDTTAIGIRQGEQAVDLIPYRNHQVMGLGRLPGRGYDKACLRGWVTFCWTELRTKTSGAGDGRVHESDGGRYKTCSGKCRSKEGPYLRITGREIGQDVWTVEGPGCQVQNSGQ